MTNLTTLKKHVALLLVMVLAFALVPAEIAIASARVYTLSRDGFTMEFRVVSAWNAGYNAEIVLRNNTNEGLYQWVLNLNRDMGLTANAQGAWLAHQNGGVTTLGYMDSNSYIPAGGSVSIWLTNTSTNGVVPVPTDFRLTQATRRRVPSEDYTYSVNPHSEWNPYRFGLGLSTVNTSNRVIQGWELEFNINGIVETTSIGTLTYVSTGSDVCVGYRTDTEEVVMSRFLVKKSFKIILKKGLT
ncbi:MAG: cellulose binding domain-containing protein [Defluviitaleaceae bacterium]|nr:cellulose binding domain-containing protein [Defluviitaleaceae bacterium]